MVSLVFYIVYSSLTVANKALHYLECIRKSYPLLYKAKIQENGSDKDKDQKRMGSRYIVDKYMFAMQNKATDYCAVIPFCLFCFFFF